MLKQYKEALIFLVKYILVYFGLNTLYAFYINYHLPGADPVTIMVSGHVSSVLSFFDPAVHRTVIAQSVNVPVFKNDKVIIEIFEGCNSVNVMVVFISFLVAFKGPLKRSVQFAAAGLMIIYGFNLLRVMGLYGVAQSFPDSLYFFHKFFFTGIIYGLVFVMWFYWVKRVKAWRTVEAS